MKHTIPFDRLNHLLALVIVIILCVLGCNVFAASVSIAWDPPIPSTSVTGYKIYHGQNSRDYTASVDAGNKLTGIVDRLDPTKTYYFALTAYNSHMNESEYSAELVWDNTPPELTAPASIELELEAGAPLVVPDYRSLVTVTDNFSTGLEVMQSPAAGSPLVAGMEIVFSATDEAGNTASVSCVLGVAIKIVPVPVSVSGEDEDGTALLINEGAE